VQETPTGIPVSDSQIISDVQKWTKNMNKKMYLILNKLSGHVRRLMLGCLYLVLNSAVEVFAFVLFRYTFPHPVEAEKMDEDEDDYEVYVDYAVFGDVEGEYEG
jgi:hypothetical protein